MASIESDMSVNPFLDTRVSRAGSIASFTLS